jgi:hypothetical protein
MKSLIKLKTTTLLVIPLVLACFALLPRAQAATPELLPSPKPDGFYSGFNTAEGLNALFNVNTATGQFNTALGFAALKFDTSGAHNTGVGAQALLHNTLGSFNTAVGENAMVFNTTGSMNMALGQGALANNSLGSSNTAMGFQALNANTASGNVAVGFQALLVNTTAGFPPDDGTNNAIGYQALESNQTGADNQAFGFRALQSNTVGDFNNAVGWHALILSTGSFNTAIGDFAGGALAHGSGNVYIGASVGGLATEDNHTYIRNINTTNVNGGGADFVTVNLASGLLGHLSSSRRYKEDIKPMDKASEVLYQLKPVTYRFKKEIDATQSLDYGLVAEEVAKIDPKLAIRDAKGQIESVRYLAIYNMMLNEFLKEHQTVKALKSTVEKQEAIIAQQQKGMEALVATVKEQAAQIQKVSAQVETIKPAPKVVANQ